MQFTYDQSVPALRFEHEDQFGDTFHVIVVRQTYAMTKDGLVPMESQPELLTTDVYFGDMHASSVRAESELAPYKPRCDVIVNATAWAPGDVPGRRFLTALRIERAGATGDVRILDKSLEVTGERWLRRRGLLSRICLVALAIGSLGLLRGTPWRLTRPQPFTALPVRYESAYGGECRIDALPEERERLRRRIGPANCLTEEQLAEHPDAGSTAVERPLAHMANEANPIGCGFMRPWYVHTRKLDRIPAPRITSPDEPLTARGLWRAMHGVSEPAVAGYGCVGRAWLPRRNLIGEIDTDCSADDDDCPRLPDDFDYGYWNAAPRDQQCDHLRGGERITLVNLCRRDHLMARRVSTGDTVLSLSLPEVQPYLALLDDRTRIGAKPLLLDTVVVEPEEGVVTLTWRAVISTDIGLETADLRFARTAAERAALDAMLEMQRRLAPDEEEEMANAA